MKLSIRPLLSLLIAAALMPCLCGCGSSETANGEDQHLEHFVPAHKPANFSKALEEIQHRAKHLSQHAGHSGDHEAGEFQELLDIVNWLPELAADSDLNESEWNSANAAAKVVAETLAKRRSDDGKLSLKEISASIENELQKLKSLVAAAGKPEPSMHHDHSHHNHDHDH